MTIDFAVSTVTISDGTSIALPERGVVVFVGPNNAGKSVALREIFGLLANPSNPQSPPKVVTEISVRKSGEPEDLERWLDQHAARREPTIAEPHAMYRRHSHRQALPTLQSRWSTAGPHLRELAPFLTLLLGIEDRLGIVQPVQMWDIMTDEPQNALQLLCSRPDLEAELADAARQAFEMPIFVNRYGGTQIQLLVGSIARPTTDWPEREYVTQLRGMPQVQQQGDGIRSFLGVMLSVIAARYPVVVIDEPEAFLHPPQARLLGRKLATLVPEGTQVFAATHSMSVLQGLLEAPSREVTVVRLTRSGTINPASVLSHDAIENLWRDPLLRYSNILDGLFHRGVVLCESEADSTFYAASLDSIREREGRSASDLLFTQCGGKDRMHVAISALRAVDVPVTAIADFDVLRDASSLERTVRSLGGDRSQVVDFQRLVANAVEASARNPRVSYVKDQLHSLMEPLDPGSRMTAEALSRVRDITRTEGGWAEAKRNGLGCLSGDPHNQCAVLLERLALMGLFVVPIGELERFCPGAAGLSGSLWVAEALRQNAHRTQAATDFVGRVDASFDMPPSQIVTEA